MVSYLQVGILPCSDVVSLNDVMLADCETVTPDEIIRFFSKITATMTTAVKRNCQKKGFNVESLSE